MKDYYYILGINDRAGQQEIKTAYRKLSLKFHPDKNGPENFFEKHFKEIQEAYETLSNEGRKREYDLKIRQFRSGTTSASGSAKAEEEIKRKYEEEFKKRETELKRKFESRETKIKEDAERRAREELKKSAQKTKFRFSEKKTEIQVIISILGLIFVVWSVIFKINQDKIDNKAQIDSSGDSASKSNSTSIKTEKDIQPKVTSESKPQTSDALQDTIAIDKMKKYYEKETKDRNVILIRKVLDDYIMESLSPGDEIEEEAVDSINGYNSKYIESKFVLLSSERGEMGGSWLKIMFIEKPDKVFKVWIMHNQIIWFGDAHWAKESIEKIKQTKYLFAPEFSF